MWSGIPTMSPGAGIPSVAIALQKKGLLDLQLRLTQSGKALAQKENQ
jgi:hypothetical protein